MIPTLAELLFGDAAPPEVLRRLHDSAPMQALLERARTSMDPALDAAIDRSVEQALRQALDLSVVDVLLPAWRVHPDLEAMRTRGAQRGGVALFSIGEHEVRSQHHPRVDVIGSAGTLVSFEFELDLELRVQHAMLEIEGDVWLRRAFLGACSGSGRLRLGDREIAAFDRPDLGVPGEVRLETLAAIKEEPSPLLDERRSGS